MPTASKRHICNRCRAIVVGPCPTCTPQRRAEIDQARGNSNSRGYDSRWRRVIRPAFLRDNPLCCLCGALATIPDHWPETRASLVARGVEDPDAPHRLRPLCTDCHDRHGLSYRPWSKKQRINTLVTLVAGPPCGGKNTYVEQHAAPDDEVIDYDEIMARLSGQPMHHHDEAFVTAVHAERNQRISQLLASGQTGWILATAPRAAQRHRYDTSVMLLLPTQAAALERSVGCRPESWAEHIRRWYRDYEADPRDTLVDA